MINKFDNWGEDNLFCRDLPSRPQPEIGKILVTGGTGYIGGRLVIELLARGYKVRVMVREASPEQAEKWPGAEIVEADGLEIGELKCALEGIHTAYYLIHSLLIGQQKYRSKDIQTAINFRNTAEEKGIKRIIYLGGLADTQSPQSDYLKSRMKVAQYLSQGTVATTILRVPIIIGSGSAAFEIIKNVVKTMPVILVPYWTRTKCHPIGIRDVIKYLIGVLEMPETAGKSFEIGGKDVITIEMMMKILAELIGKKRIFLCSYFSDINYYAYLASFFTPVPAPIVRCIIEGLKYNIVCRNEDIKKILPFEPLSYREMILRAMTCEEQDNVHTRWSDAYPPSHELAVKLNELEQAPQYKSAYSILSEKKASSLFQTICKIGGKKGWFNSNWLWRLRGWFDRVLMGVGISRGRKSSANLNINDVIDFWRVEDLKQNELLRLRAEMKLPGNGWLEFRIKQENDKNRISVKAYYKTNSLFGKLYWYLFLPSHVFIFSDMVKEIEKRS